MKAEDNPFPSILLVEGSAPAGPGAGEQRLFVDGADHLPKLVDEADVVTSLAGQGIPAGGSTGQLLAKASGTDYDTEWTTP